MQTLSGPINFRELCPLKERHVMRYVNRHCADERENNSLTTLGKSHTVHPESWVLEGKT